MSAWYQNDPTPLQRRAIGETSNSLDGRGIDFQRVARRFVPVPKKVLPTPEKVDELAPGEVVDLVRIEEQEALRGIADRGGLDFSDVLPR